MNTYLSPVELVGHTRIVGFAGNDLITLDQLPSIETMTNRPSDGLDRAVRDTVDVDGGGGSDAVIAFVSGGRLYRVVVPAIWLTCKTVVEPTTELTRYLFTVPKLVRRLIRVGTTCSYCERILWPI